MTSVPHIETFIEFGNVRKDLQALLAVLQPEWNGKDICVESVPGGNLNENNRVYLKDDPASRIFIHVINPVASDMIPNHLNVSRLLHDNNIGPKLYATFQNGTVTEFLTGTDLEAPGKRGELLKPDLMRKSAHELARFHCKDMFRQAKERNIAENYHNNLFDELVTMMWDQALTNDKTPEALRKQLPSPEELLAALRAGREAVHDLDYETALCHCDYNPGNMMITNGGEFKVIDFDGCMIAPTPFDIAYFLHFAFNDHFNPADRIIPPTDEYCTAWCRAYLESRAKLDGESLPTDTAVNKLVFLVKKAIPTICTRLTLTSGLLSMMGPSAKEAQLINFLKFSVICWQEYLRLKDPVRAMTFPM